MAASVAVMGLLFLENAGGPPACEPHRISDPGPSGSAARLRPGLARVVAKQVIQVPAGLHAVQQGLGRTGLFELREGLVLLKALRQVFSTLIAKGIPLQTANDDQRKASTGADSRKR